MNTLKEKPLRYVQVNQEIPKRMLSHFLYIQKPSELEKQKTQVRGKQLNKKLTQGQLMCVAVLVCVV